MPCEHTRSSMSLWVVLNICQYKNCKSGQILHNGPLKKDGSVFAFTIHVIKWKGRSTRRTCMFTLQKWQNVIKNAFYHRSTDKFALLGALDKVAGELLPPPRGSLPLKSRLSPNSDLWTVKDKKNVTFYKNSSSNSNVIFLYLLFLDKKGDTGSLPNPSAPVILGGTNSCMSFLHFICID